jgi:hypothetical protein
MSWYIVVNLSPSSGYSSVDYRAELTQLYPIPVLQHYWYVETCQGLDEHHHTNESQPPLYSVSSKSETKVTYITLYLYHKTAY